MWVSISPRKSLNLKKASQIRRPRRGFRIDVGHSSLAVVVRKDQPGYDQVFEFLNVIGQAAPTSEPDHAGGG